MLILMKLKMLFNKDQVIGIIKCLPIKKFKINLIMWQCKIKTISGLSIDLSIFRILIFLYKFFY